MRPVSAVHSTTAKHGIAPVAVGQSANGNQAGDAFSALVQTLSDSGGQDSNATNADAGGGSSGGATAQSSPGASSAAASSATTAAADISADAAPAGGDDGKTGGKIKDTPVSTDADSTAQAQPLPDPSLVDGALPADLAALAVLAPGATLQPQAPAAQPASDDASDTPAVGASSGTSSAAGAKFPDISPDPASAGPLPADAALPQTDPAQTTAQSGAAQTAQAQQQTTPASSDPSAAATLAASATPLPAGLKPIDGGKPSAKDAKTVSADRTAAQKLQPSSPANAAVPSAAKGIGGAAPSGGLPPAPASGDNRASAKTDTQSDATTAAFATANTSLTPIIDGSAAVPTAMIPAGNTPTTVSSATAGIAGVATATAAAPTDPASTAAAQSFALVSRDSSLAASAVAQVNVMLQRAGLSKATSMTVSLDPAELGRVEVKLKMEKDGAVRATVTADRPQTLDMLRNDRGSLERALQSAGLSTDPGSLSFNLRGNGNSGQQGGTGSGQQSGNAAKADDTGAPSMQLDVIASGGWTESGRLDLRV